MLMLTSDDRKILAQVASSELKKKELDLASKNNSVSVRELANLKQEISAFKTKQVIKWPDIKTTAPLLELALYELFTELEQSVEKPPALLEKYDTWNDLLHRVRKYFNEEVNKPKEASQ